MKNLPFRIFSVSFWGIFFGFLFLIGWGLFPNTVDARDPAGVWDLVSLKQVPAAEWSDVERLSSGDSHEIQTQKVWYAGEEFKGRPTRVFAFVSRPVGDGPFPGIVLVHGGGGTAFRAWTELWAKRGYAAIAMDLAGHEVLDDGSRKRLEDGGPGQGDEEKFSFFEEKDYRRMWSYHAVADIMRAHSLLRSLPCVDAERTAVTGISWGGYLTSMIAGIDDRFKAAVPVYGCGDLERNSVWTERLDQMPWPGKVRWSSYFDPVQYVGNAKCRLFFLNGTDDFAYPLDIHFNTYSRVPHADVRLQVHMPHGHEVGWAPREIEAYIDAVLNGAPELPCLGKLDWKRMPDGTISVSAPIKRNPEAAVSAKLHFSTDAGGFEGTKWKVRNWSEIPAEIRKDVPQVSVQIPQEIAGKAPLRIYLEVQTADGLTVSSHYAHCKAVPRPNFQPVPEGGILLFGKDPSGVLVNRFLDQSGAAANWKVENDELISVSGNGVNHVHSDADFRDALIHAEFCLPKKGSGNCGLYIHGLYEMQILNSANARETHMLEAGAFYRFAPAQALAGLGGGEWQSYDVLYRAPRRDASGKIVEKGQMTAWLNGILVQDRFEFEEARSQWHPMRRQKTDHIQKKWEHQKQTGFAPLFLQDHGEAVRFRNVWIKPLD
ncbi:MAG: DUF1080 domain-containing protein [Thermoguttaceae bacterium]|nr:DUF1080 domain-containing protein [Thermoguttaceae bacterium]